MSSAMISNAAALRRPFIFDDDAELEVGSTAARIPTFTGKNGQKIPLASVTPASQLEIRPAPEMVTSGIPELDALTGGLPRGCLTEICGSASSGRTTVLLAALAAATRRGEFCALIDASDALDAQSLAANDVDMDRLLWVRCEDSFPGKKNSPQRHGDTEKNKNLKNGYPISAAPSAAEVGIFDHTKSRAFEHRLEQVLRATDLLLESGGFGLIVLDLADLPPQAARRIPLTTWFRFRRAVEYKPTILLAIEQQPIAGSCSSLLLRLGAQEYAGQAMRLEPSDSSRAAAAFISPARQCRVASPQHSESRRDGTARLVMDNAADQASAPPLYHSRAPSHAHLLTKIKIQAELLRSRLERKPARAITFEAKTAWAG